MLKDDFFFITSLNIESDSINATLQLNEKHKIFDGHFPGQPVVPGVCMMEMVREVAEMALCKEMVLTKAAEIKFLKAIDPNQKPVLQLLLKYFTKEDGTIPVDATLFEDTLVCFKFKGLFLIRHLKK